MNDVRHGYRESQAKYKGGFTCSTAALLIAAAALGAIVIAAPGYAQDKSIVVASTTSTQDSGLFEYLLPLFKAKTGITVKVVAQGTGQALDTGRRGDADVVFVHAKSAEEKFLAEGQGVKRYPVMYNDFVLIGPKSDPAGIKGMKDIAKAFADHQGQAGARSSRAATAPAPISPSSSSGRTPASTSPKPTKGPWYKAIGQGMGAALNTAGAGTPTCLSDRGTWIHRSRTKATSRSWSKATSACSTSTASCW